MPDSKGEGLRKSKREKPEPGGGGAPGSAASSAAKKQRRRVGSGGKGGSGHVTSSSSIQSLLTAASLLDEDSEPVGGAKTTPSRGKSDLWNADKRSAHCQDIFCLPSRTMIPFYGVQFPNIFMGGAKAKFLKLEFSPPKMQS